MGALISSFLRHVVPGVVRPLRVLWNEVIGFVFLVLALMFASPAIKAIWRNEEGEGSLFRIIASSAFALLLAGFGVHAFWRARKISRT